MSARRLGTRSGADSDFSSPEPNTRVPRFNIRTASPPTPSPQNPKEDYTQTHILPLHGMGVVVRAVVRLGVVPIIIALLVLVLRPRGLGGTL